MQQGASILAKEAKFIVINTSQKQRLQALSNSLKDSKLRGSSTLDQIGSGSIIVSVSMNNLLLTTLLHGSPDVVLCVHV